MYYDLNGYIFFSKMNLIDNLNMILNTIIIKINTITIYFVLLIIGIEYYMLIIYFICINIKYRIII